jgi:hypothetical protein
VCTHILLHKNIIEDNIYLYANNNNHFIIVINKSLLKHRHRDTIDCNIHHVCH